MLLRWLEEQRPGMWMRRGNERCWRTTAIGITVGASPSRGSGQGKKELGTQLGLSRSETLAASWCGVALAEME